MRKFYLIGMIILSSLSVKGFAGVDGNTHYCERDCSMEYGFFRKYAREGSSLASLSMAIMNYQGHGREVNIPLANRQLLIAARAEEPAAMYQLGYNLLHGLYMKQNLEKSLVWFKRADNFNVLNSKRLVVLITNILNGKEDPLKTSVKTTVNQTVTFGSMRLASHEFDSSIEHITVSLQFEWSAILYHAKSQTCNVNCEMIKFSYALLPLIHLKKEETLMSELERL